MKKQGTATGTLIMSQELAALGYKRVSYNGGAFVAYMKSFNGVKDPQDYSAKRVEVRFGEHRDWSHRVYLVFPSYILTLPNIQTVADIEALREILARGIGLETTP